MSDPSKIKTFEQRKELVKHVKQKPETSVRLKAILRKYASDPIQCETCGRTIIFEDYWYVDRWAQGKTVKPFKVCRKCASSDTSVLAIIDGDRIMYGIAYVDDFFDWEKYSLWANDNHVLNLLRGFLYNPYIEKEEYESGLRRSDFPARD